MRSALALLACLAISCSAVPGPATAQSPPSARGLWITEDGKSNVEVSDCGGGICARIVWLKQPVDAKGKPLHDANNENERLRAQPILGLPLFEGMRRTSGGWEGRIYNPEDGKSFDVSLRLSGPSQLVIKGCVLFICETHAWQRAPAAADRADAPPAARSTPPAKAAQ